jgi:hypothetical protein
MFTRDSSARNVGGGVVHNSSLNTGDQRAAKADDVRDRSLDFVCKDMIDRKNVSAGSPADQANQRSKVLSTLPRDLFVEGRKERARKAFEKNFFSSSPPTPSSYLHISLNSRQYFLISA